ncbi:MAG TPA: hypothetical protein VNI78_05760 [Vicinamibacterales bacterium]|nr:hypothetical protein [Vicinamibacterales bacterium]
MGAVAVERLYLECRRVALTLLAQGERLDAIERTLHAAGFHPAVAHEAVRWTREQHEALEREDAPASA